MINKSMHTTPEGINYTIEVCDNGAVLVLYDHNGIETARLDGFTSVREMLTHVNDLDSWIKEKRNGNEK